MGNGQERMVASGFLKEEEMKNRTMCTPFILHRSSRVLRGNSVNIALLNHYSYNATGQSALAK